MNNQNPAQPNNLGELRELIDEIDRITSFPIYTILGVSDYTRRRLKTMNREFRREYDIMKYIIDY